jgi:hypothetical protein
MCGEDSRFLQRDTELRTEIWGLEALYGVVCVLLRGVENEALLK